jgi:hypothetical protein
MPLYVSCRAILFVAGCGAEAVGALFFVANRIIAGRKAAVGNIGAGADIVVADAGIGGGAIIILLVDTGAVGTWVSHYTVTQRPPHANTLIGVAFQYDIGPFRRLAITAVHAWIAVFFWTTLFAALTCRITVSTHPEITAASLFTSVERHWIVGTLPCPFLARNRVSHDLKHFTIYTLYVPETVIMTVDLRRTCKTGNSARAIPWITHTANPFSPFYTDTVT